MYFLGVTDVHAHAYPPPGRIARLMHRMRARTPRWAAPLAVFGCIGASLAYTEWVDPARASADTVPTCLVRLTTGLDCPGCGGTRAAWYLMHGDLPAAARHHLLFVFTVPFALYLYVAWAGRLAFGWKLPMPKVSPVVGGIFIGAWAVFMVLRNLPWAPFTYFYV